MPPKQSLTLTEAELRIMDVLWRRGSGTVQQVLDWLSSPWPTTLSLPPPRSGEKRICEARQGRPRARV